MVVLLFAFAHSFAWLLAARALAGVAAANYGIATRNLGAVSVLGPREGLGTDEGAFAWAEDARGQIWMAGARGVYRFADGRFIAHALRGLEARHPTDLAVDRAIGAAQIRCGCVNGVLRSLPVVEAAACATIPIECTAAITNFPGTQK